MGVNQLCSIASLRVCAAEIRVGNSKQGELEDDGGLLEDHGGFRPMEGGPAACAAEFPFDAEQGTRFVFSVPVNGFQNDKLRRANISGANLWLNYTDSAKEGTWVIPKIENENGFPTADAGLDRTLECGPDTVLSGLGSVDPDGDPLTYTWTGPFETMTGSTSTVRLPPGTHEISLTVDDGRGGVSTDSVTVLVRDTKQPFFAISPSPLWLSPDNGQMVPITITVYASDACVGEDVGIELQSIVAYDSGLVPNVKSDIEGAEFGTGDLEFWLRATRSNPEGFRMYIVTYQASDRSNRPVTRRTLVAVFGSPPYRFGSIRSLGRPVKAARRGHHHPHTAVEAEHLERAISASPATCLRSPARGPRPTTRLMLKISSRNR